ncbi:MAG: hypothetical protein V4510_12880 [bacterium]
MKFSETNPPCTEEDVAQFVRGTDEEASWMHDAPMDAWLGIEELTEDSPPR